MTTSDALKLTREVKSAVRRRATKLAELHYRHLVVEIERGIAGGSISPSQVESWAPAATQSQEASR